MKNSKGCSNSIKRTIKTQDFGKDDLHCAYLDELTNGDFMVSIDGKSKGNNKIFTVSKYDDALKHFNLITSEEEMSKEEFALKIAFLMVENMIDSKFLDKELLEFIETALLEILI